MTNKDGKNRIVDAALELFAKGGIENASTRSIARQAGLAEGTIYRHFPTKDDLAAHIFLDIAARLRERLETAVAQATDPAEKLRLLVEAFFRFAQEEPAAYEYITHRHPPLDALPANTRLPKDVVAEVVRRGYETGAFKGVSPALGTALVIGMIIRSLFFLRHGLLDLPAADASAQVARAALRALKEDV